MDSDVVQTFSLVAALSFDFLGLPAELRKQIYELALLQDEPSNIIGGASRYEPSRKGSMAPGRGLFRVSRMVHEEATPIFYGQNEFRFIDIYVDMLEVTSALIKMGRNAKLIRTIYIRFPSVSCFPQAEEILCILYADNQDLLSTLQDRCAHVRTLKV
jgi:hypothetical protein